VQLGRPLPLILDAYGKRALEAPRRIHYVLSNFAPDNPVLRRVPHLELACRNLRGRDNFKIGEWHEVPDFQLALAYDGRGRRLHSANADHSPRALAKNDGRGARQWQVVDLVGLPACDGGGVKPGIFAIWLCSTECIADGLRVLRGEHHPHHLTAVLIMLENFLADELTLAVAIGGEPNPPGGA